MTGKPVISARNRRRAGGVDRRGDGRYGARWIKTYGWTALTVGVAAEAALDTLPDAAGRFYVHASSGFASFAKGGIREHRIRMVFTAYERNAGKPALERMGERADRVKLSLGQCSRCHGVAVPSLRLFRARFED